MSIRSLRSLSVGLLLVCSVNASAQHFQKKDLNISVGYGIGNIWKKFLRDNINIPGGFEYSVSTRGPFCLLIDYALFKRISAGIAVGYSKTYGNLVNDRFPFHESLETFSVLARGNYHLFNINRFDPYIGLGAGYYHFKYRNEDVAGYNKVPGIFGYSLQLGARFYFTKSISVYSELGYIAGSFGQAGVCFKLR